MTDKQQQKQEAIDLLRKRLTKKVRQRLREVDERLLSYCDGVARDVSTEFGDEADRHSMWEVLCVAKFVRMFTTYHFNAKQVQFYIALREGQWTKDGKTWRYLNGGLRLPSTNGAKVYRWQPFQIFVLASVFGFYTWIDTQVEAGMKEELLETEREKDDTVWDYRRMVSEFIMYGPRKIDKTGLSSFIQLVFFLFGDFNSEIYALAMTSDQSKILYDRTKFMLKQVDKSAKGDPLFRMTEKFTMWQKQYQQELRNSKIVPLTGGGKAPDGTNTELLNWDELGSSPYVNGKSDMQAHINVCQSSMGQRRQPLTFGTTTAGTITSGPFIEKLTALHQMLLQEIAYDTGEATPTLTGDTQMCLLLEPDEYEKTESEYILTSKALRAKLNPMLGIIVQHDFYERELLKARQEGEQKFAECVAKLFNVYQSGRVKKWVVTADDIRALQRPRKITDCKYKYDERNDWSVFVGLDFSGGGDLFAMTMLAVNYAKGIEMKDRFFTDTYLWILESSLLKSPNRYFYEKMAEKGWLRVCPGKVFNPDYAINELIALNEERVNLMSFCYDPAQSHDPINTIKAWLQTLGMTADLIKQMVIPVNQGFMNMNPLVQKVERMVLSTDPWLTFSENPLWPWMFGNVQLVYSRDETLCRPQKSSEHAKIDGVAGLLDAIYGFDLKEGRVEG